MQVIKIYPSHFIGAQLSFKNSRQWLPFFKSHHNARQALLETITQQQVWQITDKDVTVFIAGKIAADNFFVLTNCLYTDDSIRQKQLLQLLDNFCRQRFLRGLRFEIKPERLSVGFSNWLLKNSFQNFETVFTRQCHYQTALVLGGGGARGAYQIGVWQALQELQIDFEMITGTSVGALNGALILLNDQRAACQLWESLSTDQVLQFPAAAADNHALILLLRQIRSLTLTALRENGASTEPLQQIMKQTFDEKKMGQSPIDLYVCTTRLPDFSEKVYHFQKGHLDCEIAWLSASASFYPAMKATQIAGSLYIDGGYRNNVPIDVAVKQGATECIVVDVKGPGFTKKYRVPQNVTTLSLSSPWTLGSFLVFDPECSKTNLRLGYLETLKHFQRYTGFWYTFTEENFNMHWHDFCQQLRKMHHPLWQLIKAPAFWRKLHHVYGKKVAFETTGIALVELSGIWSEILPAEIYREENFITQIKDVSFGQKGELNATLSVAEWLNLYRERLVAWSDSRLFFSFLQLEALPGNVPQILWENFAVSIVTAEFSKFLFQSSND
ncbi:patatin-like phospholipase family protein [Enterococcus dispar]|uniref:patatin-like phospholipase family protein n=1 Tax=Enterococcus dispar TaxID=44009 RepID=UPI0021D43ABF|nr:patatin-like phospholipase family protein [Enterococcus dispar]